MSIQDLMRRDSYELEHFYTSEDIKRIKRNVEYDGWLKVNEAALNIQKVYKGTLEKDYLLKFLEDKYQNDMKNPALVLQSVYRQVRI